MAEFVPSEFFADEPSSGGESPKEDTPKSPSPKKGGMSWLRIGCIAFLIITVVVVAYMYYKKMKDKASGAEPHQLSDVAMSTEHENIVANVSKDELTSLLNNDFTSETLQTEVESCTPKAAASSPTRDAYLGKYASIEGIATTFIASLPPQFASSIITAKRTYDNVKNNVGFTPTEMDSFATFYGLDVMNKILNQRGPPPSAPSEEKPAPTPQAARPSPITPATLPIIDLGPRPQNEILLMTTLIDSSVLEPSADEDKQESYVEELPDGDEVQDKPKKVAFQLEDED